MKWTTPDLRRTGSSPLWVRIGNRRYVVALDGTGSDARWTAERFQGKNRRTLGTFPTRNAACACCEQDAAGDRPEPGRQYRLTGASGTPAISNGSTWAESEVTE